MTRCQGNCIYYPSRIVHWKHKSRRTRFWATRRILRSFEKDKMDVWNEIFATKFEDYSLFRDLENISKLHLLWLNYYAQILCETSRRDAVAPPSHQEEFNFIYNDSDLAR